MGAKVIAAASSAEKLEIAREAGADELINYTTEDLKARVREITGNKGVDVVYDPVGGDYSETALRSTGWGARYLVIGFAAGPIPKIPLNLALLNSRDILGVFWGAWAGRNPRENAMNMTPGDTIRIDMRDKNGKSIFGAIEQDVVRYER